jgi:hypothetical protein
VVSWTPKDVPAPVVVLFEGSVGPGQTWGKQALSARGFKRVGRRSEHAI